MKKVDLIEEFAHKIAPHAIIEKVDKRINDENVMECLVYSMLEGDNKSDQTIDFVIDCTGENEDKFEIAHFCLRHKIPFLTTGNIQRLKDPLKIHIRDIKHCHIDPVINEFKLELRKEMNVKKGIDCVYSSGDINHQLEPFATCPTFPPLCAFHMSTYVLNRIAGEKIKFSMPDKVKIFSYIKMLEKVENAQIRYKLEMELTLEDVISVCQTVWKSRCAISEKRNGWLNLAIWDKDKKICKDNVVLIDSKMAKKINNCSGNEKRDELFEKMPDVRARIERVLETINK